MAGKTVKVSVYAETKQFKRAFRGLTKEAGLNKLSRKLRDIGGALKTAVKVAGAAGVALGAVVGKMGADLEQSQGAIIDVFKTSADEMLGYAKKAATAVGLSKNEYSELGTLLGAQLKNANVPMNELAGKTNELITLGADMAAMFGGSTKDAVNALSSALKGERDPIERYGVTLKQAAIDAKAAEMGFTKVGGAFDQEAQAAATLALVMEQTSDAHGKFAREGDTFTHQVQVGTALLKSFAETVGAELLPPITDLAARVNDWLGPALEGLAQWVETTGAPAIKRFADTFQTDWLPQIQAAGQWVATNLLPPLQRLGEFIVSLIPKLIAVGQWLYQSRTWLAPIAAAIITIVTAVSAYIKIMNILKAAKVAYTAAITAARAAQIALNAAMAANPFGIITLVIAALVAAIVTFFMTNENARKKVVAAWNSIKTGVLDAVAGAKEWITNLVTTVAGIPGRIKSALSTFATTIAVTTALAFARMRTAAAEKVGSLVSYVAGIPGRIKSALGNLGSLLYNAGANVINGLVRGIKRTIGKVKETLSGLTHKITEWKGPPATDARLLEDAGRLIIGGLINGLESKYTDVRRSLAGLTRDVAATPFELAADIKMNGRPGRSAFSTAPTINITVNALEPSVDVGRRVATALERYLGLNGAR